jgi:hypothetical protein
VAVKLEKNLLTAAMSDPLLFSLVQDLRVPDRLPDPAGGGAQDRHPRSDRERVSGQGDREVTTSCSPRCTRTMPPSTVTRLSDMKIEPYVIASALLGVVAQRLGSATLNPRRSSAERNSASSS